MDAADTAPDVFVPFAAGAPAARHLHRHGIGGVVLHADDDIDGFRDEPIKFV
jgi:hypothetical protein